MRFVTSRGSEGRGRVFRVLSTALSGFVIAWITPHVQAQGYMSGAIIYDPSSGAEWTALSNGNGTYNYVSNSFTPGYNILRTGDFNGDGKADLIVYNTANGLGYILMGNGDGHYTSQSLSWGSGYDTVECGDLNADGKTDVVLYNSSNGAMYAEISNGAGGFTYTYSLVSSGYSFVRVADFTGDGKRDVFLYNKATGIEALGIGNGAGGFSFQSSPISAGYDRNDVGDLDGDGKMDVLLYNSASGVAATGISDGLGGFRFTPYSWSPSFSAVNVADYTGDGKAEVTLYNKTTAVAYFGTRDAGGSFTFGSLFWSPDYDSILSEDVNGDGKADVILYRSSDGTEHTGISNGSGANGFTYTYTLWSRYYAVSQCGGGVASCSAGGDGSRAITSLTDLQTCLNAGGPSTCALAAQTFTVSSTININRYGVTLSGANTSADHTKTRLVRGSGFTGALIRVAVPGINQGQPTSTLLGTGLTGIVIRDLTVCGGGNSWPNKTQGLQPAIMSPAGSVSTTYPCADQKVAPPTACSYDDHVCVDLDVNNIDSGYYPSNPFANTGPYALEINNVDMEDAAGHAMSLYAAGPNPYVNPATAAQKVNDVWMHNSVIAYSAITGMLYGFNNQTYGDKFCDTYQAKTGQVYADSPSLVAPRNIRIENNTFKYNNTGAMGGGPMRWVGLRQNSFFVNYIQPQAGNNGGGTIQFDHCADRVDISNNIFTGPSAATVQAAGGDLPGWYTPFPYVRGLALASRNTNIANNTITAHGWDGVSAASLLYDSSIGYTITQNHILRDNSWAATSYFGGITVGDAFVFSGGCDTRPRDSSGVTVTANDSNPLYAPVPPGPPTIPFGVKLAKFGYPTSNWLFNVTVDPNNFSGTYPLSYSQYQVYLDPFVGLYNYSGQPYYLGSESYPNPNLLPADVTTASSSTSSFTTLWPVPPLCGDQSGPTVPPPVPPGSSKGSPRATFKFSASDLQGSSNILQIQGVWSDAGSDFNGTGGPGGTGATLCSFLYQANTVYLWDYALNSWKSSNIGSATDLVDTGYGCVLHAGTSKVSFGDPGAYPKSYVLDLTLDMTLPPALKHYHIYSFVENGNYKFNTCGSRSTNPPCPTWNYWGYWPNYQ